MYERIIIFQSYNVCVFYMRKKKRKIRDISVAIIVEIVGKKE